MPALTGKTLYVAFKGTNISGDYRKFDPGDGIGTVDQSAGADAAETYLPTLTTGDATYAALLQADGSEVYTALAPGGEGTLEWAEEGTADAKMRHWVNAIVTGRKQSIPYKDVIELSATFLYSGTVTHTVYPA